MRTMSKTLRDQLEKLPRMKKCAVKKMFYGERCNGQIQWHHVWIYGGKQINEPWAIIGACSYHHEMVNKNPTIKDIFERESLMLASKEDLAKYPRVNWDQHMRRLTIYTLWHQQRK